MYPPSGYSIFDDKGEVKQLVEALIRETTPEIVIERIRKIDFAYIFILSKGLKTIELELTRSEIDASWGWRSGNVDEALRWRIQNAMTQI
jgi:hypothetical protein